MNTTISYTAIKVKGKPLKVEFTTLDGRVVEFKNKKDIPKIVRRMFPSKAKR